MIRLLNTLAGSDQQLKDQWPILAGSFITMLIIGVLSLWITPALEPLLLVASIGASIILVFVLPTSPVSQPYPLLMGNLLSAVIGVSCAYLPLDIYFSAPICISACMLGMFWFRCIHPPGGATAMMPLIVGPQAVGGYNFVIFPVLINMIVLVVLGILFHRWWLKQEYPSRPLPASDPVHKHQDASPLARLGIGRDDLEAALKEFDVYLNISEKDLVQVYGVAQQKAYTRKFGEIRCQDIMSRDVKTVGSMTDLEEAWALLRLHKVKLLPVVDHNKQIIGVISLVDYLKRAGLKSYEGFAERLVSFVKGNSSMVKEKPRHVGQIMAAPAFTVNQNELIASLVPLLSDKGLHHIPVVNDDQQLVGIVTQSDLIAALYSGAMNLGDKPT